MRPLKAARGQRPKIFSWLLVGLLSVLGRLVVNGAGVSLSWDPSADATVVGYKIYYGTTSQGYTSSVNVGNVLSATITGLTANTTYYFAATTYTAAGVESDFSNEAVYVATQGTTNPPAPNYQPPTLDALGNLALNENAGLQTVNLTGLGLGTGQTLVITAVSSNPSLIPNPSVNYTSPNSTGSLTFAPAQYASGTATITVTANNGLAKSNLVTRAFTVMVSPVNQAPTLNPIADVAVNYSSAATTTVNLSGLTSGAPNENQKLTVTALSSNPQLVAHPTVNYTSPNSTGTLNLKTTGNTSGSAIITVTVNDGGTSNNLATQTFNVTVTPGYLPPTLNPLGNVSVTQNAGVQSVALSGIGAGSGQLVTIQAVSDKPALIPNPVVTYITPATTGTLKFTPAPNQVGTATITVTVNNGQPQNNLITRTFAITVAAAAPTVAGETPTLDPLNALAMDFASAAKRISLTGVTPGKSGTQKLKITAVSSNPKIVPNPKVNYSSPQTAGSLDVKPAAGTNGTALITVTVNDGGKSNNLVARTFTVTVAPNQPPTLDVIGNVTVANNAAAQLISLSGITSGTSDEVQKLKITALSSNPKIVPNPKVTYKSPEASGTLSFKPVARTNGTALITVFINDGAKANNLTSRTFTITVTASPDIAHANASSATTAALLTAAKGANGQIAIAVNGVAGTPYQVEASTDLLHWTPVYTNNAPFTFVDGNAGQFSRRFYRALSLPPP